MRAFGMFARVEKYHLPRKHTQLIRKTLNRVKDKNFDKDRGPRRVMSRNSHKHNRYRVNFQTKKTQIG